MKRWLISAAVALCVPAMASAQSAVGLRAGARWSELETSQDAGSTQSLVIGGYLGIGLTNRLGLQLEAIYGSRGGESLRIGQDELDTSALPVDVTMDYLEIPILLRSGFPGERLLPSFFVGPYVGILLDCEITPSGGEGRECAADGAAQRFHPRATDIGMVLGGALDIVLGESTIFVDARYALGLLSIESGDEAMDARHGGFAVSGGFAVPLGR